MKDKFILDACCGPRCMWWDKHHPNCIYIDKREFGKGYIDNRGNRECKPDLIMDFKKMDFPDKSFKLVVMDPPHIIQKESGNFRLGRLYGLLNPDNWRNELKKGFDECWRVLDDYGVLIFKWNCYAIKKKEILKVLGRTPLFGHPHRSKIKTIWFCFMKIPEEKELGGKK